MLLSIFLASLHFTKLIIPLIDIFCLKLSWANFDYFVSLCFILNVILSVALCSAQDTLLGIVSISEAGPT